MVAGIFTVHLWDMEWRKANSNIQYRKKPWDVKRAFPPTLESLIKPSSKLLAQIVFVQIGIILGKKNPTHHKSESHILTAVSPSSLAWYQLLLFFFSFQIYFISDFSALHQPLFSAPDLALSTLSSAQSSHLFPACSVFPFKAVHPGCLFHLQLTAMVLIQSEYPTTSSRLSGSHSSHTRQLKAWTSDCCQWRKFAFSKSWFRQSQPCRELLFSPFEEAFYRRF